MEIEAGIGEVTIRQAGQTIVVPVQHVASLAGRLTRAALEAQQNAAMR